LVTPITSTTQNIELQPFPTYVIIIVPINEIQLILGKTTNKDKSTIKIQEEDPQVQLEDEIHQQIENQKNSEPEEPRECLYLEPFLVKYIETPLEYDL